MPLPPAMPTWWRRAPGSSGTKKRPCGAITSMLSPGRRCSLIQFENTPPLTLRTPTRSSPSSTPAQIEYERRRSWPSMLLAQRQVLALGEAEDFAQVGRHVEGDDHGLVGVGLDARARASGWK